MAPSYPLLATLIVFLVALPAHAVSRFRLVSNRLTVVLEVDRRYPVVAVGVRYPIDAGGRDLERAHGLCYLSLQTELPDGRSFVDALDQIGASDVSASANPDAILYSTTVPKNQLPQLLQLESKRMSDPLARLDTKRFRELRVALVENYRDAERHRPLASSPFEAGHRYHRVWPTPTVLENLTLKELLIFQRRAFAPQRAELIVVGDFFIGTVLSQIQHAFGSLPPALSNRQDLGSSGEILEETGIPSADSSTEFSVTWRGPGIADEDSGAIEIFTHALNDRLRSIDTESQATIRFFQDASILNIRGLDSDRLYRLLTPFEETEVQQAVERLRRRRFLELESVAGRVRARQAGLIPKSADNWVSTINSRYPRTDEKTLAKVMKRYIDITPLGR